MNGKYAWGEKLNHDWNLAILAFQRDFIDRSQFVRSVELWTESPQSTPLEILESNGELDATDLELLTALQADRSTVVGQSATSVAVNGDETQVDSSREVSPQTHWTVADANRFEIEKPLATGGLGSVSVAYDRQLNRRVAYKELREHHATDPINQARFLQEAEITSRLEHPAIAPVYSLGIKPDGTPFYAMRLIQGQTWKVAVEQFYERNGSTIDYQSVEFRRLAGQLVEVCRAIDFAHERNILHRDIKPANIVLGRHGETVVVDWGLAKQLDRETNESQLHAFAHEHLDSMQIELTAAGAIIGTPAYMSPEQAQGGDSELDRRSDIFSLGATLYFLLAGRPPYIGETQGEVLLQARNCDYPALESRRTNLPGALVAICRRAMARNRAERYESANNLAADLENWLADQPVAAYRDSVSELGWRFIRQNRRLTQFAAFAIVLIAIVTSVLAVLLQFKSNEAEGARIAAHQQSEINAGLAAKEHESRLIATRNTQLAVETMRAIIFQIQRKLSTIPQAQSVRKEMLTTTLTGLNRLTGSLAEQDLKDHATMAANNDLGMIYLLFGSQQPEATQKAIGHFQTAIQIAEELYATEPDSFAACRDLSIAFEHLGDAEMELGHWDLAERAYENGLDASAGYAEKHPNDQKAKRDLAFCWEKIGDVHLKRGQTQLAADALLKSHGFFHQVFSEDPANSVYQRDICVSLQKIGNLHLQMELWDDAINTFSECLDRVREMKSAGNTAFQQRDENVILNKLGTAFQNAGRIDSAIATFKEGLAVARELATNADNRQSQRDLTISLNHVGDVLRLHDQTEDAVRYFEESLQIRRQLAAADAGSFVAQTDLASVLAALGKVAVAQKNVISSREKFEEAKSVLDKLDAEMLQQSVEHRELYAEIVKLLDDIDD